MKLMLRWRIKRHLASLLAFALTLSLGEGLFGSALVSAAKAAPTRKQSVVVFEVQNSSSRSDANLSKALTKQLRLAIDQSPAFDLVDYTYAEPYSPQIERAVKKDQTLQAQDLTPRPPIEKAIPIARVLGADLVLMAEIDEDGYVYDQKAKSVTVKVTALVYNVASATPEVPWKGVSVTGIGSGDNLVGVLEDKALRDTARQVETKLAGREVKSDTPSGDKHGSKARKLIIGAAAVAAVAILAASLFGGDDDDGPAGPLSVSAAPTREGVLVSWTPSSDPNVTGYRVYRAPVTRGRALQPSGPYQLVAEVPAGQTQYEDKAAPVSANASYLYQVRSLINGKEGGASVCDTAAAPGQPAPVTGLQAVVDQRSIQLTWLANKEDFITGYRVYRSTQTTDGFTKIADVPASQRTFTDTGSLAGGQTYFYKVTAVGANGQESDLNLATAVSKATDLRPSAPRGVLATTTEGKREVVISWQASAEPDVQYYQVYRGLRRNRANGSGLPVNIFSKVPAGIGSRGGPWQLRFDRVNVPATSVIDNEVDFNTSYFYVVTAVSSQGESPYSEEVSATPNQKPGLVQNVTVQAGDGVVTVRWAPLAESDIQGYIIYRQAADGNTKVRLTETALPAAQLTYEDKTVANDTGYLYFVSATDASGEGPISAPAGPVTPTAPPAAPMNLRATASNGKVNLVWSRNSESNLKEYLILRSDSPTLAPSVVGSVPATKSDPASILFTDANAQNLVTYYYEVQAVNTSGVASPSSERVAATPDVPPARPENVQATASDRSVTIVWSPVTRLADGRDLASVGRVLRGYAIYRTLATTGVRTLVKELPLKDLQGTPRYEDRSMPEGVGLRYSVTAVMNDSLEGTLESEHGVPVDTTPVVVVRRLTPPTGFQAMPGDQKITFTWNASSDPAALGYVIYGSQSASGPFVRLFPAVSQTGVPTVDRLTTTYEITQGQTWIPVENDRMLWFRIATVDGLGVEGTQSDPAIAVVPNPVPPQPLNVVASNTDGQGPLDMAIRVQWAPPTVNGSISIAGYRVYRVGLDGIPQLITDTPVLPAPSPSFVDRFQNGNMTPSEALDQTFTYSVVTLVQYPNAGAVESRPAQSAPVSPVDLPPARVQNVHASASGGVVTITWDAVRDPVRGTLLADITRYGVIRREKATGVESPEQLVPATANTTSYTHYDTAATAGTAYEYRVVAYDYTNRGPESVPVSVTP